MERQNSCQRACYVTLALGEKGASMVKQFAGRAVTFGAILVAFAILSTPAFAEKRIALVIANSAYAHAGVLSNAISDGKLMAATLKSRQFKLFEQYDGDQKQIKRTLQAFSAAIQEEPQNTVALIYYAGHGIQYKGENYLVPVDAEIAKEGDIDINSITVSSVMSMLDASRTNLNIVILDACRNNPFPLTRSTDRGLARVDAPSGSLVAFSTAPGKVARDGDKGGNSPYTAALAQALAEPGVKIEDVFKRVRSIVHKASGGEQTPWESSSLIGDFYPAGMPRTAAEEAVTPATEAVTPPPARTQETKRSGEAVTMTPAAKPPVGRTEVAAGIFPSAQPPCDGVRVAVGLSGHEEKRCFTPGNGKTESFRDCPDCPELVVIPSGSFIMGSPENEKQRFTAESPQHRVTFQKPFAVGKFTVSYADWDACVADGGCGGLKLKDDWGRGDLPLVNVTWTIAHTYLEWLEEKTGKTYRLLSEAEWEYTARAGTTTTFWWGPKITPELANYNGTLYYTGGGKIGEYRQKTVPVNSFQPNPWGLYQVHGNVFQWVEDCASSEYKTAPVDGSAQTSGNCSTRIIRGGSWKSEPMYLRAACRHYGWPEAGSFDTGFRVARAF